MIDSINKCNSTFTPRSFLKNRHLQSIMASSRLVLPPTSALLKTSEAIVIQTSEESRLLSYLSDHPHSRGLIIILHGWEGSASSAYVLAAGSFFFKKGFSVCRLNLRDHGESHHLNEGLFHGALLQETFDAVQHLAGKVEDLPVYLMGFSLGANFSLRIAIKNSDTPIKNLNCVFAISPPLDPYKTTLAIDNGPSFYRTYFLRKWRRSLKQKQKLFPHIYDFSQMVHAGTCMELTSDMMTYFPQFSSYRDYFHLYTLNHESFGKLSVPVRIFIAEDDPVIPIEDFHNLNQGPYLKISREKFGGHCGFVNLFPYSRWYNDQIWPEIMKGLAWI